MTGFSRALWLACQTARVTKWIHRLPVLLGMGGLLIVAIRAAEWYAWGGPCNEQHFCTWDQVTDARVALWRAAAACAAIIVIGVVLHIAIGRNAPRIDAAPITLVVAIIGVAASIVAVDFWVTFAAIFVSDHAVAFVKILTWLAISWALAVMLGRVRGSHIDVAISYFTAAVTTATTCLWIPGWVESGSAWTWVGAAGVPALILLPYLTLGRRWFRPQRQALGLVDDYT